MEFQLFGDGCIVIFFIVGLVVVFFFWLLYAMVHFLLQICWCTWKTVYSLLGGSSKVLVCEVFLALCNLKEKRSHHEKVCSQMGMFIILICQFHHGSNHSIKNQSFIPLLCPNTLMFLFVLAINSLLHIIFLVIMYSKNHNTSCTITFF